MGTFLAVLCRGGEGRGMARGRNLEGQDAIKYRADDVGRNHTGLRLGYGVYRGPKLQGRRLARIPLRGGVDVRRGGKAIGIEWANLPEAIQGRALRPQEAIRGEGDGILTRMHAWPPVLSRHNLTETFTRILSRCSFVRASGERGSRRASRRHTSLAFFSVLTYSSSDRRNPSMTSCLSVMPRLPALVHDVPPRGEDGRR